MALPLILANILGGVGQGLAGAGEAVAQARKDARAEREEARKVAAQKSLEQHQRRMEEIGAEKGTVSPETLAALFGQIGLPVPSNLASLGRIPEGFARGAMERAAAQMERDRVEARQAAASQQAKAAIGRYRESGTPDTETMAFQSPEEGSGMTPQTVPGRPRDGLALLAELIGIPNLSQQHVTMAQDVLKPQAPHMVSDTTAYVYDQGRFVPVPGAGSTPPPPPPEPGTTRTTNIDWRGRRSFSDKPHQPPQPTASVTIDALTREKHALLEKGVAPTDQRIKNLDERINSQKLVPFQEGGGVLGPAGVVKPTTSKPPEASERKELAALDTARVGVQSLLKDFEKNRGVLGNMVSNPYGALRRGAGAVLPTLTQDERQFLAGLALRVAEVKRELIGLAQTIPELRSLVDALPDKGEIDLAVFAKLKQIDTLLGTRRESLGNVLGQSNRSVPTPLGQPPTSDADRRAAEKYGLR